MKIKDFNSIKEALIALGLKQGFDLSDKEAVEKINSEVPFDSRWLCYYSYDWDNDLKERFHDFLKYMQKYQDAMDKEDIKSASCSFGLAVLCVGSLKSFFECLESDVNKLLDGESKTNDFQWTQFDDE
ncbi:DUF6853 family protein [Neisseria montereyensis]|uniref:Uncharacterized protein n=1 Tax=Neisseria montereyensis TaxID=2973938 RepID=A0ABT2FBE4_9NEIS|nr:hypothetical protein [Neisseria montereyensis]MCS4533281.1 hypothetical protein [Neisseria montereyensis]